MANNKPNWLTQTADDIETWIPRFKKMVETNDGTIYGYGHDEHMLKGIAQVLNAAKYQNKRWTAKRVLAEIK